MNKFLMTFLVLMFINIVVPLILSFLFDDPNSYITYLLWINALGIFYAFLPERAAVLI